MQKVFPSHSVNVTVSVLSMLLAPAAPCTCGSTEVIIYFLEQCVNPVKAAKEFIRTCIPDRSFDIDPLLLSRVRDIAHAYLANTASAQPILEDLVHVLARNGYVGEFMPNNVPLLSRPPKSEEALMLMKAYVSNKASRSESTEKMILAIIDTVGTEDEKNECKKLLDAFIVDWDNAVEL